MVGGAWAGRVGVAKDPQKLSREAPREDKITRAIQLQCCDYTIKSNAHHHS